ncbi:hypothetical protein [Nonomuraea solani]|nr:hypothetical protein [Nonomuraea solani]
MSSRRILTASSGRAWPRRQGGKPGAHLIGERPGSTATTSVPRCDLFNCP